MMKIWACCEVRASVNNDYEGYACLIDWDSKRVVHRVNAPHTFDESLDEDAIGKYSRGIRSVTKVGDEWYALVQGGILVLNNNFQLTRKIVNDCIGGGGHYLINTGNHLITNTPCLDTIVRMTYDGEVIDNIEISTIKAVANSLRMKEVKWDKDFPQVYPVSHLLESFLSKYKPEQIIDQLHINTIQVWENKLYVFSCSKRALIEISPEPRLVKTYDDCLYPHDCIQTEDLILINDSGNSVFRVYDRSHQLVHKIPIPKQPVSGTKKFTNGWVRGLIVLDSDRVIIGSSPFELFEINVRTGKIIDGMKLSTDVRETCHGINTGE